MTPAFAKATDGQADRGASTHIWKEPPKSLILLACGESETARGHKFSKIRFFLKDGHSKIPDIQFPEGVFLTVL